MVVVVVEDGGEMPKDPDKSRMADANNSTAHRNAERERRNAIMEKLQKQKKQEHATCKSL